MVLVATEKVLKVGSPQKEEQSLQSVLKGAFIRTIFVYSGLALVFESARNSLRWHLAGFWGSAGNNWQQNRRKMTKQLSPCYLGTPNLAPESDHVYAPTGQWLFARPDMYLKKTDVS
jgi:hypothetical protein